MQRIDIYFKIVFILFLPLACSDDKPSDDVLSRECVLGDMQSPLNLDLDNSVFEYVTELTFRKWQQDYKVKLKNTGKKVIATMKKPTPSIFGAMLFEEYVLDNMEFHWPAEHTIDKKQYDLELQMFHYAFNYSNFEEARKNPDGIAALSVFFKIYSSNSGLADFFKEFSDINGVDESKEISLSPKNLIPSRKQDFFRYKGSFTSSPCEETVTWIVYTQPISISQRQFSPFTKMKTQGYEYIKNCNRPVQKVNGRPIQVTTKDISGSNPMSFYSPTLIHLLSLFGLLYGKFILQ